jgi:inosine-uridine nucleoside N-ribohydrolase
MEMEPAGQQVTDTGTAGVIARLPLLFLAALLLGLALDRLLLLRFAAPWADMVHWIITGPLTLIGLALASAGIRNFLRAGMLVPPKRSTRSPVTTGLHAWIRVAVPLSLLATVLLAIACTVPVRNWRTGEAENRPLSLTLGGPHVDRPSRVWIDTDAACTGGNADPDDCFAMLILMNSPDVEIVGISTVFGNAPLSVVDRTTRDLVRRVVGSSKILVHSGSSTAFEAERTTTIEPAHAALERALEGGPLTIVCLGPLTNVAATVRRRPDLADNIGLLVAVMGRRPGHVFHPAEGRSSSGMLFGHGPIFRDFNFSEDRTSASIVLELVERISLTPYAAAREVMVARRDLARMKSGPRTAAWLAEKAEPWLDYWEGDIGLAGFYPFDALAALYVMHPRQFNCAKATAWIAEDERLPVLWRVALGSTGLLVGLNSDRPQISRASGSVTYCGAVGDGLNELLMDLLTKQPPAESGLRTLQKIREQT